MKHLISRFKSTHLAQLAITSLLLLCGCVKTEINTTLPPDDKLYFNVKFDGRGDEPLSTRAYSSDINFGNSGFTVVGYQTKGAFSTSNPSNLPFPNIFDYLNPGVNDAVINITKDPTESINRQYWAPLPRLTLSNVYNNSYFAWSSSISGSITAATSTANDKGTPWIEANVGAANTPQPDIVGALSMNHSNEYTVSALDFDFKHLLSKMSFLIKTSNGMTANITKVECVYGASAVFSKARFTFDGTAEIGSWSNLNTYLTQGTITPTDWNSPITATSSALLGSMTFIPQDLSDNALSLNITYTTTQGGATSAQTTRNVRLKAINMEQGKNYVYTLDVDANKIDVLNVKVEGWVEIAGTDKGLPLVPGIMDPDVLLILEGIDPPYTISDGSKYWLDRSGWNNHCLILDKTHYNGVNSFDITYNADKRGYVFNRPQFSFGHTDALLYNHIRIPDLGSVQGDIGCEIVCHNQSNGTDWKYPTPLSISQGERVYGNPIALGRTLLLHINENNKFIWDYANNTNVDNPGAGERIELNAPSGYNWNKLSFYGYSRTNGKQKFCIIDNTNSSSATAITSNITYPLKYGIIGAAFKGIINYIKISKRPLTFDATMSDYRVLAKKYYIKTAPGIYAPSVNGLIACWDARSGLVQGGSNGNGAYWMDQSGNGSFLRATVPQGINGSFRYDAAAKAIVSVSPTRSKGIYMEMTDGIEEECSALTIEFVSQSINPYENTAISILDKDNKQIFYINPNCETSDTNYGIRAGSELTNITNFIHQHAGIDITRKRSIVYTIDFKNKVCLYYANGTLTNTIENFTVSKSDFEIAKIVAFNAIEQGNYSRAFTGNVHALRIYNRVLSNGEIITNYNKDRTDFRL